MSAAAAEAVPVAPKKGAKKLILILAVAGLVLALAGGGAIFYIKQQQAAALAAEEGDEEPAEEAVAKKHDPKAVPTFLPLEPFVVNLADREQERFAQIGITLQVGDAAVADQLKAYMPAIRNGVLLILAHKTSTELLGREGKEQLAAEIMRESVRPLGIELPEVGADAAPADDEKPAKRKRKAEPVKNPVEHVHFSSFIIQ